jgi:hypothetical protein
MKKLFVLIAAVAFVVAFTAPAFAAEWSFYGSARIHTFWEDYDYGDKPIKGTITDDNDFDLDHKLQGNARIGANVKVSDNLVGRFEYGSTPNLRLLYGEYDFGGFKLLVGQDYTPLNWFYSNQVWDGDYDLLFAGGVYNGRRAQVTGKFGGFKIALVQPVTTLVGEAKDATWAKNATTGVWEEKAGEGRFKDTDVVIPNLQASYNFKVAGLSIDLGAGWQAYQVVDGNNDDENINSWFGGIGATYNMGPFYFAGNYWMGKNVGNMGMTNDGFDDAFYDEANDKIRDNDGWGFILVAAFTMSDMLRFEAGYAKNSFEVDKAVEKDDTSTYYVQATINLAKGVFIVPEIGVVDYGDDRKGVDEGKLTYYGLKWQINF